MNITDVSGDKSIQPRSTVLPAGRAGGSTFAPRARCLLASATVPRSTSHLHDGDFRTDQVRKYQAQDEQQTRESHVTYRVQQLHQATRDATADGFTRAVARFGPGLLLRGAARPRPLLGAPLPAGAGAPAARQLSRARALAAPRNPLIESLLFYERDARRDLFFYFPRGRPAPPAACDIRTIFHNFLYSRSLRRCVNLSIGAIICRATRRRFIFVIFNAESSF